MRINPLEPSKSEAQLWELLRAYVVVQNTPQPIFDHARQQELIDHHGITSRGRAYLNGNEVEDIHVPRILPHMAGASGQGKAISVQGEGGD